MFSGKALWWSQLLYLFSLLHGSQFCAACPPMSENHCFTYVVHFSSGLWWKGKSSHKSSLRVWNENCYHYLLSQILQSALISIPANFSTSCSTVLFMPNSIFFYPLNTLSIFQLWGLCTYSFFSLQYCSQSSFSSNVTFSEGLCWPMSYSHPSASQTTILDYFTSSLTSSQPDITLYARLHVHYFVISR